MKKKVVIFIACFLVLFLAGGELFAQSNITGRTRGPKTFDITIMANVNGAKVFVDGAEVGVVPYTAALAAGDHTIKVTAPGYNDYDTTLTVAQAETINATLEMKPVSVKISANVAATLTLNGKVQGNTPQTLQLVPGNYSLNLTAAGYKDMTASITVAMKSSQEFSYTLERATAAVTVTANVAGAKVAVDNVEVGAVPYTASLTLGDHAVKVTAPGYYDFATTLKVAKAETINATLEMKPVSVKISANVAANLTLNGKAQGITPQTLQLLPGNYTLNLTATGYKDMTASLAVAMKSSQEFAYTLELATVPVSITANNVKGATIKIEGETLSTTTGKSNETIGSAMKLPGKYNVEISAKGYKTLRSSVTVPAAGGSFKYTLEEEDAVLIINLANNFLNPELEEDAISLVKIYVDGRLMNAVGAVTGSITVTPGTHEIRIVSGGLSVAQSFAFKAGETLALGLNMALVVVSPTTPPTSPTPKTPGGK